MAGRPPGRVLARRSTVVGRVMFAGAALLVVVAVVSVSITTLSYLVGGNDKSPSYQAGYTSDSSGVAHTAGISLGAQFACQGSFARAQLANLRWMPRTTCRAASTASETTRRVSGVMLRIAWAICVSACTAVTFAPLAGADPTQGHFVNVQVSSPRMRCEVGSDDDPGVPGVPGMGPNVVCQTAGFPQAPMNPAPYPGWPGDPLVLHQDQAVITASGQFSWRTANLGSAPPGQPDTTVVNGQTYRLQGWTVVPTSEGVTFTDDATGHGMMISSDYSVKPF